MLRSLYSGISGMKVNQVKLDVIANNIANVGTTAFKSSRVRFKDMVSQSVTESAAPGTSQGGVNLKQVGQGVQVSGIDTMVGQGMMQPTSRKLDVAMDGEGYLMVAKGEMPETNADGVLLTADSTLSTTNEMQLSYTRDGALTLDNEGNLLNSDGLRVLGYSVKDSTTGTTSLSYATGGIITQTYVNSISKDLTTNNELIPLVIPATINVPAFGDPANLVYIPAVGVPGDLAYVAEVIANPTAIPPVVGVPAVGVLGDLAYVPAVDAYVAEHTSRITTYSIEKDGTIKAVLDDGKVAVLGQIAVASFENPAGLAKVGGNLYEITSNSGEVVVKSGIGTAEADDNSDSYGDMLSGMLEMSNVDLAEQFTDMIVSQRAFQASGKSITTGDEILQEIINLKR